MKRSPRKTFVHLVKEQAVQIKIGRQTSLGGISSTENKRQ